MERAGIEAARDNRRIGESPASANEFVRQFRFHVPFIHARLYKAEESSKTAFGQFTRLAYQFNLMFGLHDPQLVHHPRETLVVVQWITAPGLRHEPCFARLRFDHGALVLVAV